MRSSFHTNTPGAWKRKRSSMSTDASSLCAPSASSERISRPPPCPPQRGRELTERESRFDGDAASQRIEHDTVLLRTAQQAIRPLTLDVLGDRHAGRAPDGGEPDRVVAHGQGPARVPV